MGRHNGVINQKHREDVWPLNKETSAFLVLVFANEHSCLECKRD